MTWALAGASLLLFAEVARFLAAEVRRRRALDTEAYPPDPRQAVRLSSAALAVHDRAEFQRGVGLLVRVDAALAALLVAVFYQTLAHGAGNFVAAKGVLFCLALAMGPAQLLFLIPAVFIGAQIGQPRAARALVEASVPVFAASAVCGLWLLAAPKPKAAQPPPPPLAVKASPPPAADRTADFRLPTFSASLPYGWIVVPEKGGWSDLGVRRAPGQPLSFDPLDTAVFLPPEGGAAARLKVAFTRFHEPSSFEDATATDRAIDRFRRSGAGTEPEPVIPSTLGGIGARELRFTRVDPDGGAQRVDAWVAPVTAGFYTVEFAAPESRYAQFEPALKTFMASFRAASTPELLEIEPPK